MQNLQLESAGEYASYEEYVSSRRPFGFQVLPKEVWVQERANHVKYTKES